MRVTDVFADADEALWSQLVAEPVIRVDSGRSGGSLVVDVELAPGVEPRHVLVLREENTLVLVRSTDRAVLHRVALDAPVGRPSPRRTPHGLTVTAPLTEPAPVAIHPGLRPVSRTSRLRAALARLTGRLRGLFTST